MAAIIRHLFDPALAESGTVANPASGSASVFLLALSDLKATVGAAYGETLRVAGDVVTGDSLHLRRESSHVEAETAGPDAEFTTLRMKDTDLGPRRLSCRTLRRVTLMAETGAMVETRIVELVNGPAFSAFLLLDAPLEPQTDYTVIA